MATSYFDIFPKIIYSQNNNREFNIVPDILRRAIIEKVLSFNSSYFDEYDVQDGETPEIVADKFYDDPTLHWVILHANEILDPRFEWPLSDNQLRNYAVAKYGSNDALDEVHHAEGYNISADQKTYEESNFIIAEGSTDIDNPIRIIFQTTALSEEGRDVRLPISYADNPKITNFVTNLEQESRDNAARRRIKILKPDLVSEVISSFQKLIKE